MNFQVDVPNNKNYSSNQVMGYCEDWVNLYEFLGNLWHSGVCVLGHV